MLAVAAESHSLRVHVDGFPDWSRLQRGVCLAENSGSGPQTCVPFSFLVHQGNFAYMYSRLQVLCEDKLSVMSLHYREIV